jgi:Predicted oxidoreductases (related to aryl-alcohol dehydrogenases)
MQTRRLGSTELVVSRIGLGLAAIGRPGYITLGRATDLGPDRSIDVMRDRCHELLDAAWENGVRYIDAARSYGLAESFLASWLEQRSLSRRDLTVGSKWGYTYTADWRTGVEVNEVKDHSLAALRRQLRESQTVLGPWLCLYQVHSATLESGVLEDAAVLRELARLRDEGIAAGISVSGPHQADAIRAALEVRVDGENPIGVVQATWNVLEPSAGGALEEAHREGIGVIVKEALANGRLANERDGEGYMTLEGIGRAHRPSPAPSVDAIAIAAALAQPWADVVLSGAVTVDQLRSNLTALDVHLRSDESTLMAALAVQPEQYWLARSSSPWS